jgi:hypothetical protein
MKARWKGERCRQAGPRGRKKKDRLTNSSRERRSAEEERPRGGVFHFLERPGKNTPHFNDARHTLSSSALFSSRARA